MERTEPTIHEIIEAAQRSPEIKIKKEEWGNFEETYLLDDGIVTIRIDCRHDEQLFSIFLSPLFSVEDSPLKRLLEKFGII